MLRRELVIACFVASAAGCYDPSPPSLAYLCGPDDACPTNQHCTCGQCVDRDEDAACGFAITFAGDAGTPTVNEHHPLPISIQALTKSGSAATGFDGTVKLASSWGDVSPSTLAFFGGATAADAAITLNRETLLPAVATLTVSIGAASTESPGINVVAAPFQPDANVTTPFGWAQRAAEPNIVKVDSGYRMYFVGATSAIQGIGVATSSDGVDWMPSAQPVLVGQRLSSPSVYTTSAGAQMAYTSPMTGSDIGRALSPDGLQVFVPQSGNLLAAGQCPYCAASANFPQVMPDRSAPTPDGGTPPWLMFFSAADGHGNASIARASSSDGLTWTPAPAPILQGTRGGEAILIAPRVLLDGTVFKMWYAFASLDNVHPLACTATAPCPGALTCNIPAGASAGTCVGSSDDAFGALCESDVTVEIGYATSSDGFYWARSESNPVITIAGFQPNDHALLPSAVVPADGSDPSSGVTVYYSVFRQSVGLDGKTRCLPSGILRATAHP